jgi:hypothetical protein
MKVKVEDHSNDNHVKCVVSKAVNRLPSTIAVGTTTYTIEPPRVIIMSKHEYDTAREKGGFYEKKVAEPTLSSYSPSNFTNDENAKEFFDQYNTTLLDIGPCCWLQPTSEVRTGSGINIRKDESCILVCPELATERAEIIGKELFDFPNMDVFSHYLNVAVVHEVGHHALLSCLPSSERKKIKIIGEDKTLCEGLANWYAHQYASVYEKSILAQSVLDASIAYRSFLTIIHQNPAEVVQSLVIKKDYLDALTNFSKMLGGKIDGGFNLICNGRIITTNSVFMDDSVKMNQMWNVVAKGGIETLGPLWGNVVTPKIDELSGRLLPDTLVVTSKITKHPHYRKLPSNVVLLDEDFITRKIEAFCSRKMTCSPQQQMVSLLNELGLGAKWMKQLIAYEKGLK